MAERNIGVGAHTAALRQARVYGQRGLEACLGRVVRKEFVLRVQQCFQVRFCVLAAGALFIDDDKANAYINQPMRAPWKIEV